MTHAIDRLALSDASLIQCLRHRLQRIHSRPADCQHYQKQSRYELISGDDLGGAAECAGKREVARVSSMT
jgi:hypothetical protein